MTNSLYYYYYYYYTIKYIINTVRERRNMTYNEIRNEVNAS